MSDDGKKGKSAPRTGSGAPLPDVAPAGGPPGAREGAQVPAPGRSTSAEVSEFLARMKSLAPATTTGRGRLVFAMDATKSREPTWDLALSLQADMFEAVKSVGGLDVQLVYFRGHGECAASKWVSDPAALKQLMTRVSCHGGLTQIGKVLAHARRETEMRRINALVYVGDAMEEEVDALSHAAGELGLLGVPVFLFQEGRDPKAIAAFREIARLSKGAHCRFDQGSAEELRALLTAVAVYAAGGRKALEALSHGARGRGAQLLLEQMKPKER